MWIWHKEKLLFQGNFCGVIKSRETAQKPFQYTKRVKKHNWVKNWLGCVVNEKKEERKVFFWILNDCL